jgi:hypothetical protein
MKRLLVLLFLSLTVLPAFSQESSDSAVFGAFLDYAQKEKITKKPTGERVAAIAGFFLGVPYVASTLEADGPERLQVNLRGLDCTTFVENVLALHNLLKEKNPDFAAYKRILTTIRYRNGVLNAYPSRLHYASDWLKDNHAKGFLNFVKMGKSASTFQPCVNYMSTHPDVYAALKAHPEFIGEIAKQEACINQMSFSYCPKEALSPKASFIHTGDMIAITTNLSGLDFSHLGFAVRQNGQVYLLHASSSGKKVMISENPLSEYLAGIKKHTGIVVLRPR